jgi:hypothetical protein
VTYYLAGLVDAEYRYLEESLGRRCAEKVSIRAYATLSEFRSLAGNPSLTSRTRGTFDPGAGEIHMTMTEDATSTPSVILLHEATHFYLHRCFDFPVPAAWRKEAGYDRLLSVPWWLQEGMAACMEPSRLQNGRFETGMVNAHRYRELRGLIGTDAFPGLEYVLRKIYAPPLRTEDYAVAWGIVHTLVNHKDPAIRSARLNNLSKYLKACRKGFFKDPERDFQARFVVDGKLRRDFRAQWSKWVSDKSLELFKGMILGGDDAFAQWRRSWQREILDIR